MPSQKPYQVLKVVPAEEVPNKWQRREPKWDELTKVVLELKPGDSLPVVFDSANEAKNARNAVRDNANIALGRPLIRTRMIKGEHRKVTLFFIRMHDPESDEVPTEEMGDEH